jgi:hypothetical protein
METPSFCHSHPLVTASVKVVTLEDRWERFLLKGKKKVQPSGSLEKNPLTYHVNGYNGLRCVMSIEDSDECERSLQTRRTGMSSGEPSVTEAGAEVVMGKKE